MRSALAVMALTILALTGSSSGAFSGRLTGATRASRAGVFQQSHNCCIMLRSRIGSRSVYGIMEHHRQQLATLKATIGTKGAMPIVRTPMMAQCFRVITVIDRAGVVATLAIEVNTPATLDTPGMTLFVIVSTLAALY